jgi:hypothetical protein
MIDVSYSIKMPTIDYLSTGENIGIELEENHVFRDDLSHLLSLLRSQLRPILLPETLEGGDGRRLVFVRSFSFDAVDVEGSFLSKPNSIIKTEGSTLDFGTCKENIRLIVSF